MLLLAVALVAIASPTPQATLPPQIYHTVSRPLCSALKTQIQPALALMMQSDATIAKAPSYFNDYIRSSTAESDAGRDMAVTRLGDLVGPLAQNTLAVVKLLEDPAIFPDTAHGGDDEQMLDIKDKMLHALATQQASLDIINGFVQTQQLGEMQHEGFGYLGAASASPAPISSSEPLAPRPFDDLVLNAGLQPNQYEIDPTRIPGLAVGYNQISTLRTGLEYTQALSKKSEAPLAQAVIRASVECGAQLPETPSPEP